MKNNLFKRYIPIVCLLTTGLSASQVLADWYGNQPGRKYNQGYGDFPPQQLEQQLQSDPSLYTQPAEAAPQDYRDSNPWDNRYQPVPRTAPDYQTPNYTAPNYTAPDYQTPNYGPPNYGGYERGSSNSPFGSSGPGFSSPSFNSPGFSNPWNNRGSSFEGPWNDKGSSFSPWGGRGGNRNPFGNRNSGDWFNPNKGSMSRNWDDALNAPSRSGEMPGGWTAPSISAPNPIDVGDEFDDAARDLPDQMDNFNWNDNRRRNY